MKTIITILLIAIAFLSVLYGTWVDHCKHLIFAVVSLACIITVLIKLYKPT